jgi:hypothetical protein
VFCGETYHDQNAMKKPRYEKKKTRPYLLIGLKTGIDRAFLLYGLSSGADQSVFREKPMLRYCEQICELQALLWRNPGSWLTSK